MKNAEIRTMQYKKTYTYPQPYVVYQRDTGRTYTYPNRVRHYWVADVARFCRKCGERIQEGNKYVYFCVARNGGRCSFCLRCVWTYPYLVDWDSYGIIEQLEEMGGVDHPLRQRSLIIGIVE